MVKLDKDSLLLKFEEVDEHHNISHYIWGFKNIQDFKKMVDDETLTKTLTLEEGYKGWFVFYDDDIRLSFCLDIKTHVYPKMKLSGLIDESSNISILNFSDKHIDEKKYLNSF